LLAVLLAFVLDFPAFLMLLFAALLGSLMVTDHATRDRASYSMMHEVASKTPHDGAFDAALGIAA
jgi:hypothetical protein